jgi:hypothetical protein
MMSAMDRQKFAIARATQFLEDPLKPFLMFLTYNVSVLLRLASKDLSPSDTKIRRKFCCKRPQLLGQSCPELPFSNSAWFGAREVGTLCTSG